MSFWKHEEGMALGVALVAMVVTGALVASVFFISTQEYRAGSNELSYPRALAAAEYGHDTLFTGWAKSWGALKRGDTLVRVFGGAGWSDTVRVTKLNQHLFYLVSQGSAANPAGGAARRRTGFLVRLRYLELKAKGSATIRGQFQAQDQTFDGNDHVPQGWAGQCDTTGTPVAGYAGSQAPSSCQGCDVQPPQLVDPVMNDTNTYFNYGPYKWADLVAMATKIIPEQVNNGAPSYIGATCNTGDEKNFGEPDHTTPAGPCDNYFPIVYRDGKLQMTNTQGQGILLVNGEAQFQDVRWFGLVIIRGKFQTQDEGTISVQGAFMAANTSNQSSQSQGGQFLYSSCAIQMATQQYVSTERVKQRAWVELF